GALRAHQTVRRSHAGCLPRLFAALRVRAGGAAQPTVSALRSRAAVPLPFSRQQPRDEREAAELFLAGVLRPRDRSHPLYLLAAGDRAALPGDPGRDPTVDERGAGGVVRRVRPHPLSQRGAPPARYRSAATGLFRPGDDGAPGVLREPGAPRPRAAVAVAAAGRAEPRPPRLPQGRSVYGRFDPPPVNCLIRIRAGPMVESLVSASR